MIRLEDRSGVLHDNLWAQKVSIGSYKSIHRLYIAYEITITTINQSTIQVWRRYSDFEKLYDTLVSELPNEAISIPRLPPKTSFNDDNELFLMHRKDALEYFMKCVLLNPYLAGSMAIKQFVNK